MKSVAIVGCGIAGLAAAHALAGEASVTLFEAGDHFGGHTNTVDVTLDGITHGVDTGFLVFNERSYPRLVELFATLDVPRAPAEMSFSVQSNGLEWSGSDLNALFAQRRNLLRPRFWSMLADLQRFNHLARSLAADDALPAQTLGDFLDAQHFGHAFRELYLLPMLGCIWSCPTQQMLRFPLATLLRFCDNHGLLQITQRPQWYTVAGGARQYVRKMLADVADARLLTPVQWARRLPAGGALVHSAGEDERFDELVLACHSDQALALLIDASADERALLGAIGYQRNRAVLHTDPSLMPRRRRAWAAWNYERAADATRERGRVCLHYWLNRLQPLPWWRPLFVSLNPLREPAAQAVLAEFDYAHPVFDQAAIDAQRALPAIQGRANTWYCGAWTGYGFHEDGLRSGLAVAEALRAQRAARPALRLTA